MFIIFQSILVATAAILPAFVWLVFFLKEDIHPEPKRLIIFTFLGGAFATIPAVLFQAAFQEFFTTFVPGFLMFIIIFALIEEVLKFAGAYFTVGKNPELDEPVDTMIYMIAAAMGFAAVENVFVLSNIFNSQDSIGFAFNVLILRFVGAVLLHVVASALVGYYWGKVRFLGAPKKILIWGILVATAVHVLFNYLIIKFAGTNILYPTMLLVFVVLFVFVDFEKLKRAEY